LLRKYPIEKLPFEIEHIDPLGQGVSKIGDKVSFIPKTLPGETGEAEVLSEKKGVRFLRLSSLLKSSPERVEPVCPHFDDCPSCHFLHTSYENELKFKTDSLKNILRPESEIIVHSAPNRLNYRNRVQLHYSKKEQKLGYKDAFKNKILEVPKCLIGEGQVQAALKDLYNEKKWYGLVKKERNLGHLEIYSKDGEVSINVNKPYASGGFTQVYKEMNNKLKMLLKSKIKENNLKVLDLFGGNGNLTKGLTKSEVLVVDISPRPKNLASHQDYFKIDLKKKGWDLKENFDVVIVDPPRAGFKDIEAFFSSVNCQEFFYVSCNPATLKRDLEKISNIFKVLEIHLLDLFPSTYHFETMVHLSKR